MKRRYKSVTLHNHPLFPGKKQVDEHRFLMAEKLGRELLSTEIVHHEDEDPKNNDVDGNLELMEWGEHSRLHNKGRPQSIEVRLKRSASMRGRKNTKQHIARTSAGLKARGDHRTPEEKANLSRKLKGRSKSEVTKERMKASWTPERRAAQAERLRLRNARAKEG